MRKYRPDGLVARDECGLLVESGLGPLTPQLPETNSKGIQKRDYSKLGQRPLSTYFAEEIALRDTMDQTGGEQIPESVERPFVPHVADDDLITQGAGWSEI